MAVEHSKEMREQSRQRPVAGLGPLEQQIMVIVWQAGEVSVRDVCLAFDGTLAYTTLMTTLDRLHKKGLLTRRKEGRAFFYSPQLSPQEFERNIARSLVDTLLGRTAGEVEPVLACIVDAVSEHDRALLDELDSLIKEKRRELQTKE
jgi:predicted transcriptional regulator